MWAGEGLPACGVRKQQIVRQGECPILIEGSADVPAVKYREDAALGAEAELCKYLNKKIHKGRETFYHV